MGQRVRLLAGLVQTRVIATEYLISMLKPLPLGLAALLLLFLAFPDPREESQKVIWFAAFILSGVFFLFATHSPLALTAIPRSWYAVQRAVETLVSQVRGTIGSRAGTTLEDIAQDESTRRIFCTTDLSSGSHVYFTPGHILTPDGTGRNPNVFLSDVVTASACFPGFRPVVFRRTELGLSGIPPARQPRVHHYGRRLLVGLAGFIGVGVILSALAMRLAGPLSDNENWRSTVPIFAAMVLGGAAMASLCARTLWVRDDLTLVDGGVCDNLGTAFALLAQDTRYPDLPRIAGTDKPGLILVVDASQPFTAPEPGWRGFGELIPLRLRGAQRTVLKLLGNANSMARKRAIQLLLSPGFSSAGAIVSIEQIPELGHGQDWRPWSNDQNAYGQP